MTQAICYARGEDFGYVLEIDDTDQDVCQYRVHANDDEEQRPFLKSQEIDYPIEHRQKQQTPATGD